MPEQRTSTHSIGAVIVALIVFFPLGLYWMWRDRLWGGTTRWMVTAAAAVLVVGVAATPSQPPTETTRSVAAATIPSKSPSAAPSPSAALIAAPQVSTAPPKVAAPVGTRAPAAKATAPIQRAPAVQPAPVPVAPSTAPPPAAAPAALCGAPNNPYGYNYCGRGVNVYSPPADVCNYFSCIGNFFNGKGYMVECNDTMVSMSGGRRGACSYHGGELRPVTG